MKMDEVFAQEMLQLIANARTFAGSLSRDEFLNDHKITASVLLELIMLGELAKRAPDAMKEAVAIPWKDIAGFRDSAIHQYSKRQLRSSRTADVVGDAGTVADCVREEVRLLG